MDDGLWLSASVACMDPLLYEVTTRRLEEAGIDGFHFDVCDGHFAPTIMLSAALLKAIRPLTRRRFDVHLYCTHPSRYLEEFTAAGADLFIVHLECHEDLQELVRRIRALGKEAGLGLLPSSGPTPDFAQAAAGVRLVMANTVGPAYSGQPFDPRGLSNAARMRDLLGRQGKVPEIGLDGAVSTANLPALLGTGASHLVLGTSSIFRGNAAPEDLLRDFRKAAGLALSGFRAQDSATT